MPKKITEQRKVFFVPIQVLKNLTERHIYPLTVLMKTRQRTQNVLYSDCFRITVLIFSRV